MSVKKLPYGQCNFADIIESGYAYVDKTRYIEQLENEANRYQFVLRPRRFGKSLFLSVLDSYYDINSRDKFEALFGGLYISGHPTPERGKYAVLSFDFSCVETESHEIFRASFIDEVQRGVCSCLGRYKNIFAGASDEIRLIKEQRLGLSALHSVYESAKSANIAIFVIIDEYDNFANNLAAMEEVYREEVIGKDDKEGIVRTFYKSLKAGTSTAVRRIFITGVSPMMVNDLTSGFNIATDYSLVPKYNEMFGFTRGEVERLLDETGIDRNRITVDMEYYYNGYMFDNDGLDKVYNSQMVLFLFYQIELLGKMPDEIIDPNLKTKYERLQHLVKSEKNQERLLTIATEGGIAGRIYQNISIGEMNSDDYFLSMMFYLGMLTCGGYEEGDTYLKIPNFSIRTLYWDYVVGYVNGLGDGYIDNSELSMKIKDMAYRGNIKSFLDFFAENFLKRIADRDLRYFNEKHVKMLLLGALFTSKLYSVKSEDPNINGYSDIHLKRNPASKPAIKYEYVLELKHVATKASRETKAKEFAKAFAQIEKYRKDPEYAGRDDVKFVAVVFVGKRGYEVREA